MYIYMYDTDKKKVSGPVIFFHDAVTELQCVDVTRVPLYRQQVVGDAPHGLQGGVSDLIRRQDDVSRVGGAAPGQDGDGVCLPSLQRPVAHIDVKLHVGQPHLQKQDFGASLLTLQGNNTSVLAHGRPNWAPFWSERAASRQRTS